jgi:hypothetical protein
MNSVKASGQPRMNRGSAGAGARRAECPATVLRNPWSRSATKISAPRYRCDAGPSHAGFAAMPALMVLVRVWPMADGYPEYRNFQCRTCGEVLRTPADETFHLQRPK